MKNLRLVCRRYTQDVGLSDTQVLEVLGDTGEFTAPRGGQPSTVGYLTQQSPLILLSTTVLADMFPAANARGRFRSRTDACIRPARDRH